MAQHDEKALERVEHERVDGCAVGRDLQEEGAEAQQLAPRLVLALASNRGRLDANVREEVRSREHPMAAMDVVELHRERVGGTIERVAVEEDGEGKARPPALDDRGERLEDVEPDPTDDDDRVHIRAL